MLAPLHNAPSDSNAFRSSHSTQLTLADLPDEAQAAISAALGGDQSAYYAARAGDGRLTFDNLARRLSAVLFQRTRPR